MSVAHATISRPCSSTRPAPANCARRVHAARVPVRAYSSQGLALPRKIESVNEVMKLWNDFKENNPISTQNHFYNREVPYLYGFGFRGLKSSEHQLIPSAFRRSTGRVDEQSFYYGFRLLVTEPQKNHRAIFDWLTLMQHYETPTRLLDWSESVLKGLYFAVEDPPEDKDFKTQNSDNKTKEKLNDGVVWVLNSYKLNKLTSLFSTETGIGVPDTLNAVIRAEMTTTMDIRVLFRKQNVLAVNAYDLPHADSLQVIFDRVLKSMPPLKDNPKLTHEGFIHRLHSPFALQSYQLNERIKLQNGFFTIFGGKASEPDKELDESAKKWALGKYKSLEELNDQLDPEDKFMVKLCVIPATSKKKIYNELFELGIHKATVYGDLPNISKYIVDLVNRFDSAMPPRKK